MRTTFRTFRSRLVPAVLTAAGVALISAGLLSYDASSAAANPSASATPTIVTADPSAVVDPSLPPINASVPPTTLPSATPNADRVATRVVVEALDIDLPVIKPRGGSSTYPQCNVAMYIQSPLRQPGQGGSTYLYAHARDGMFGPIYERAILKQHGGPKSMIGMVVQVYTSDDQLFEYTVTEVRLHQLDLDDAIKATAEELWLQTSEGPKGTPGKTQLLAQPLITLPADHAAAHPTPHPVNCG